MREYTTREVAELAGLPEGRVRRWTQAGLLTPNRDERGRYRYSFQDLALLRTAARLLEAGLTPNRVTRSLRLIGEQLPDGRPLSAVRIFITGNKVVVRDRLASWEPDSRQGMLDFDVQELSAKVAQAAVRQSKPSSDPGKENAEDLYETGIELELSGRERDARNAYEAALDRKPDLVGARINLGRLMHVAGRLEAAESHYRRALEAEPDNALAAFNLGVALEDQGRADAAVQAYQRAIASDDAFTDAYYNLSRLLEARGEHRDALRHLSRFKRLLEGDI